MYDFDKVTRGGRPARSRGRYYLLLAVALVLAGAGSVAGAFLLSGDTGRLGERIVPGEFQPLSRISDEPKNILVLGVDKRPEGEGELPGVRADTIMLVRIYPETGQVKILSIPRDMYVEVRPGEMDKINASYSYDGISGTVSVVERFTGVPVDHYAVVDFAGFESAIDAMGGLKVETRGELPPGWKQKDGIRKLSGKRTLIYVRYRGTSGGDLDRIERQQQVLAALRSQALKWDTARKLPEITESVVEHVQTNLGVPETVALGQVLVKRGKNSTMTATKLEGTPEKLDNGSEVLVPDDRANADTLQDFLD